MAAAIKESTTVEPILMCNFNQIDDCLSGSRHFPDEIYVEALVCIENKAIYTK
jgi:hypothetical protein